MGHIITARSVRLDRLEDALKTGSFHHYCGECDAIYPAADEQIRALLIALREISDLEPTPDECNGDPDHEAIRRRLAELVSLIKNKQLSLALPRLENLLALEFDLMSISALSSSLRPRYRSVGDKLAVARTKLLAGDAKGGAMTLELALAEFARR